MHNSTVSIATSLAVALKLGPSIFLIHAFTKSHLMTSWWDSFWRMMELFRVSEIPFAMLRYQSQSSRLVV